MNLLKRIQNQWKIFIRFLSLRPFMVVKFSLENCPIPASFQLRSRECMETRRNESRWSVGIDRIRVECGTFYIGVCIFIVCGLARIRRRYAGVALFAINFLSLFRSSFIHAACVTCPIIFRVTHVHSHVLSLLFRRNYRDFSSSSIFFFFFLYFSASNPERDRGVEPFEQGRV